MKNLVLCCDGTANEFAHNRTNVVKLFSVLIQDRSLQAVYYHPGLGTMEPPGALINVTKRLTRLFGKAFGFGLEADIRDAYAFIMQHYEPGDRVFLFGFSRGAYTVRAVASLLYRYGLLPRGNEAHIPYAIRLLGGVNRIKDEKDGSRYFRLAGDFKDTFGTFRPCKPWFVGVWDTVSSIGWLENPLHFPDTANNPDIAHGRHAIAIDERRAFFRTNLWRPEPPPNNGPVDLKQVWFAGVHSDVGGGYPEEESGLSKIALKWMLDEAIELGLLVDEAKMALILGETGKYAKLDPNAKMHESLTIGWWPAEFLLKRHYDWQRKAWRRRMNLGRPRTIPSGSLIHGSVRSRGPEYTPPLPSNAVHL